jgi:hypothetical protein
MARLGSRDPVFAPREVAKTLDGLSKNDLIDLVWTFAGMTVESAEDEDQVRNALALEINIHSEQKSGVNKAVVRAVADWLTDEEE